MKPREFLEILHVAERLKDTTRHCTTSKGRPESVAEHSWRLSLMALLLRHEFPDVPGLVALHRALADTESPRDFKQRHPLSLP